VASRRRGCSGEGGLQGEEEWQGEGGVAGGTGGGVSFRLSSEGRIRKSLRLACWLH
jgi:hypothetical protein